MGMFDKFPYRNTRDLNLNWIIKKILELEGLIGAAVSDVAQFLSKKGGKMEGSIDMQSNRIFNVPTPAGDTDVTSKKYVDDKAGNYLPLAGGTMTGAVNMGGNKITSVADPEAAQDVATKKYVDDHSGGVSGDYLPLAGGTMTGAVNMGGNKITNVANPTSGTDVANKTYVESKAAPTSVKIAAGRYNATIINQNTFEVVFPLPFVLSSSSKTTAQISSFAVKINTLTSYAGGYTFACSAISTTKTAGTNVIRFEITSTKSISEEIPESNVTGAAVEVKTSFTVTK